MRVLLKRKKKHWKIFLEVDPLSYELIQKVHSRLEFSGSQPLWFLLVLKSSLIISILTPLKLQLIMAVLVSNNRKIIRSFITWNELTFRDNRPIILSLVFFFGGGGEGTTIVIITVKYGCNKRRTPLITNILVIKNWFMLCVYILVREQILKRFKPACWIYHPVSYMQETSCFSLLSRQY